MPWDDKKYIGVNTADNGVDTSAVTSDKDGTVLERLEYVQSSLSSILIADFVMSDMDDFDVPDADADTVRWNPEYITGTEGGSADIDTTTSDCLMVKVDPDSSPTEARYAVSHNLPFYADFLTVTTDMATTWGTMGTTGCAAGIILSKGSAYDSQNYLAIERVKSSSVNRITVSGKLNNVAISSTNAAITDDALAFKVSRYDDVWRFYYSLTPYPNEVWVLVAQVEDPSVYMSDQVTLYYEAYSKGSADAETIKADFGHFRYLVGSGGGGQYITGDYDSSWVTANADGNVMEREEYLQDMTQYLYGVADGGTVYPTKVIDNSILSILMTKQSGGDTSDFDNSTDSLEMISDKLGTFTGDGGTDQGDSVKANQDIIITDTAPLWDTTLTGASVISGSMASFVATGGTALGTVLPASTSLYDTTKQLRVVAIDGTTPPVANTLSDILHKDGSYTYDNTTDSLEALANAIALIPAATGVGTTQIAITTEDLNQAASTYDLLTGTTQPVILKGFSIKMPTGAAGGALTSISVQTDDATPGVIFNSTTGAVANLTSEAELSWTGIMRINVGTKIQLTIAGGAHGSEYITTITAEYKAIVAGGTLA